MTAPGPWNDQTASYDTYDNPWAAARLPPVPEAFQPGEVLNEAFRVESKLGEGGMGTVYRGVQLLLGRAVAIKTISSPSSPISQELVKRIFREAKILSQLNHPQIVSIIDFGTAGAQATPFMVMELLTGKPLDAFVTQRNRPPLRQVLALMMQICAGVAAAHQANIIHRDLKPSNVFLTTVVGSSEPLVKILDFGLARPATPLPESGPALTQIGVGVGTCGFTAPEQMAGQGEPDARADVYGLGALFYFLLTGQPPYKGQTMQAVLTRQITQPPDPIDFPSLGLAGAEVLETVLVKAMSRLPEDRYQSVGEFKGALEAILTGILSNPKQMATFVGFQRTVTGLSAPTQTGGLPQPVRTVPPSSPPPQAEPTFPVRRRMVPWLVIFGLLVGGGGVAGWWALNGKRETSGSGETRARPPLTATAPGVTATEITVGLSAPFSGPNRELGRSMQVGIETYFEYLNDSAGGVHGRKLKLLALDDRYEPEHTAETMKKMLGHQPVFAFLGNVGAATAEVALPLALAHKRLFFGAFTGSDLLRGNPPDRYVFNYRASFAEETAAIIRYLLTVRKIKPEQIAVFAQEDSFGESGYQGVARALRMAGFDSDQVLRLGYRRNSANLEPAVKALLAQKDRIKAVVMVATYRPAAALVKRLKDAGMAPLFTNVSFVGSEAMAEEFREMGDTYGAGLIVTQVVPFFGSSATAILKYRERLKQSFPAEQPGFVSLEGYLVAQLFGIALDRAGPELTTEKVVEALESLHDLDLGIGTKISFSPMEHQGSHKVWACVLDNSLNYRNLDLD